MGEPLNLSQITLISFMKRDILQQICDILDTDNTWETIAAYMPGIHLKDVEACKKFASFSQSPSKLLLRVWCAKGYTTNHLYQLFAKTKLIRLMRIIKPEVNEKFYYLEDKVLNLSKKSTKPKVNPPGSQSASRCKKTESKESSPAPTQSTS
uniref:Death domain-containing protein n=2 Tax=Caenorhabditis japonica TaxID=281687 RepID=A0A8R1I9S7_CAEJA